LEVFAAVIPTSSVFKHFNNNKQNGYMSTIFIDFVVFPGNDGHKHRQRIFELVGIKTGVPSGFKIREPSPTTLENKPIQKDILGRLGHVQSTHARKAIDETPTKEEHTSEPLTSVPAVPKFEHC
jgi:hypothetical protein